MYIKVSSVHVFCLILYQGDHHRLVNYSTYVFSIHIWCMEQHVSLWCCKLGMGRKLIQKTHQLVHCIWAYWVCLISMQSCRCCKYNVSIKFMTSSSCVNTTKQAKPDLWHQIVVLIVYTGLNFSGGMVSMSIIAEVVGLLCYCCSIFTCFLVKLLRKFLL